MSTNHLNNSLVTIKGKNIREKASKDGEIGLIKSKTNKRILNSMSKIQSKKNNQVKKNKKIEKRNTFRFINNNFKLNDKPPKNLCDIIKREKSADHLKKRSLSLRDKIKNYFSEIGYYDTNYNPNNYNIIINKNEKLKNFKKFNTLVLIKKSKDDILIGKRKSYFSPEKLEQKKKNKFYKKLLNLRSSSGTKLHYNNDLLLNNYKENLNINNNNNNNNDNIGPKNKFNSKKINKNKKYNNIKTKHGQNLLIKKNNKAENYLYYSQNIAGVAPKKNNKNKNNNLLSKSSTIASIQSKTIQNPNIKSKISEDEKSPSLERITVNKNEENINNKNNNNNVSENTNNYYVINVRKIDSMTNYNTNNSININLNKINIDDNKLNKKNDICFTDENDFMNPNNLLENNLFQYSNMPQNNINNNEKKNNDEMFTINDIERSFNKDGIISNIKVCKKTEFQAKNKKKGKSQNKHILKKRSGTQEPFNENTPNNIIKRERSKNKTPNKESIFNLKHFQNYLIVNNNNKININCYSNNNSSINYLYNILPGNNGKLVEKVLKTRDNWDMIESTQSQYANLIWTPLSCQINFAQHAVSEITQYVNHFEFHSELTNKANTFINLFRYCEFNDIDLFSFYPLTIILSSNQDYLQTQIEGFKRCYQDIPNLINYSSEKDNNNHNNLVNKYYINYFFVNLSRKIGSLQKMKIPQSYYIGKNLWVLKRTNLNRGRQMKVLSNIDEIIKEINLMFEGKKPNNLIIQKYLEQPLLYNGRKFDIRIWVLFTYIGKDCKFEIYVFKEGHLKACSDIFNIDSDNLFIHLTNYSVQKHNKNFSKVEIGNEISFQLFQKELNRQNSGKNFRKDIFPEIVKIIGISAKAIKNKINIMNRKNCFEIFGYDFILDVNYRPFLLEINTNPGLEESSPLIKMLVPRMINDAFRLTIDKTFDSNDVNDKKKILSKFHVNGYSDEENMWMKIKTKNKK